MADDPQLFWIGRNPSGGTRLPYLLRLPVSGEGRIFLATRDTWPRGTDVFCLQVSEWPAEAEIVEQIPVESCWRAGAAIHLVLRRPRQRRSLFVWTRKGDRTLVFWRSNASMRRARPGIRVPLARAFDERLLVAVDIGERYPWRFAFRDVGTERRRLPVGDYALIENDQVVAAVERKTPHDLATSSVDGHLRLALAELSGLPHAALVVEGRLSDAIKAAGEGRVRPGWLLNVVAALQIEFPSVTWMFAETRQLAEDWAYRWLGAAARFRRPRALPLLDERAFGEAPISYAAGTRVLDATARRTLLLREAESGTEWTSRTAAARCGVTQVTAASDLRALVAANGLEPLGRGRARRYRSISPPQA
ncbi:MAG: ERCC4 domain-containing protein [Chloroflexi bacterium]|nr:ERCC4 domain-containing protein [Chloroflexota bacterium]